MRADQLFTDTSKVEANACANEWKNSVGGLWRHPLWAGKCVNWGRPGKKSKQYVTFQCRSNYEKTSVLWFFFFLTTMTRTSISLTRRYCWFIQVRHHWEIVGPYGREGDGGGWFCVATIRGLHGGSNHSGPNVAGQGVYPGQEEPDEPDAMHVFKFHWRPTGTDHQWNGGQPRLVVGQSFWDQSKQCEIVQLWLLFGEGYEIAQRGRQKSGCRVPQTYHWGCARQDRRTMQCGVLQFTVQQCLPHDQHHQEETRDESTNVQPHRRSGRNLWTNLAPTQSRAGSAGGNCVVRIDRGIHVGCTRCVSSSPDVQMQWGVWSHPFFFDRIGCGWLWLVVIGCDWFSGGWKNRRFNGLWQRHAGNKFKPRTCRRRWLIWSIVRIIWSMLVVLVTSSPDNNTKRQARIILGVEVIQACPLIFWSFWFFDLMLEYNDECHQD